ncbi:MAG: bifunctional 23S rRNA (guanine(2069)-N(7))-methyltransferase RlmK/23S rRNA (guanine(2445)-N(2))-methyltransferase RlmL [Anaerotardibacter sp.]
MELLEHTASVENKTSEYEFFATCPFGFESVLADELKRLTLKRVRPLQGGVAFFGSAKDGYRACLWSRCASRVMMILSRVSAVDADALYQGAYDVPWASHIDKGATISVSARGTNAELRNTQFTAVKVKDAICDKLRAQAGFRPDVQPHRPDVSVWVMLRKQKATIYLDFAGEPLHRRGYRSSEEHVQAPLKENLAAAILLKAGWQKKVYEFKQGKAFAEGLVFCDPLCGSGTFVIEAAMIAEDRAPGIMRDYWGFYGWRQFVQDEFDELLDEADDRLELGQEKLPLFFGFDKDQSAVSLAQKNAARAGLSKVVAFAEGDCEYLASNLEKAGASLSSSGVLVSNPPYGIRLLAGEMEEFYRKFSKGLSDFSQLWTLDVITPDPLFDSYMGLTALDSYEAYNAKIEATVRSYSLGSVSTQAISLISLGGVEHSVVTLSGHADQFASRLRKNGKARIKWAKKNDIHAYRVYDADLPDYAAAIDVYETIQGESYVVITEYKAPKTIDSKKAMQRFLDIKAITPLILDINPSHAYTKMRQQAKGGSQYAKDSSKFKGKDTPALLVEENGHIFEVDLDSYLDTGLFLDHRVTRGLIQEKAQGKRFLNLFAYTGTASVYAVAGGASRCVTVDLSQTYLDWAKRNMNNNGFEDNSQVFIKDDVLEWVKRNADSQRKKPDEARKFDLVFIDPPTFSNSKSMGKNTWDIQRDHVKLLLQIFDLLAEGGEVVFSGNLRTFRLDEPALLAEGIAARCITAETIPEDFSRNKKIHFCYLLKRTGAAK